jgi:hypothetical protein
MYEDFTGIWSGFSKNYYPAFGSLRSFAIFQFYMGVTFVALPLIALYSVFGAGSDPIYLLAAVATLVPRSLIAIRFQHPLWGVMLHPLAITVMVTLGMRSWWRSAVRGGVGWKGRTYMANGIVITDD